MLFIKFKQHLQYTCYVITLNWQTNFGNLSSNLSTGIPAVIDVEMFKIDFTTSQSWTWALRKLTLASAFQHPSFPSRPVPVFSIPVAASMPC